MARKKFPNFKGKKVLIFGLGLLGRGVKDAIFFAEKGAVVTVTDRKTAAELKVSLEKLKNYSIKFTLGEHKKEDILNADVIIRNAGVHRDSPEIKFARQHKIPVAMDESLFAAYCPAPIIGVTGTRGKSTTATLIATILKQCWENKKRHVYLSGNLQDQATLPLIDQVTKNDLVVLELSSWQLQGFADKKISPSVAVFTNLYPDHLNYYQNMTDYLADKKAIYQFQTKKDFCVINGQNLITKKLIPEINSKVIIFTANQVPKNWTTPLLGKHNLENISAALAVGQIFGLTLTQMKEAVGNFSGLTHRLEFVRKLNNVTFINDSTSTTPTAGQKALQSFTAPIILIAGGASKNLNLTPFVKEIVTKVKALIILEGTASDDLISLVRKYRGENLILGKYKNFADAVKRAYNLALPGDIVLLSPGCASFGLFINEFDRGEQFIKIVNALQ